MPGAVPFRSLKRSPPAERSLDQKLNAQRRSRLRSSMRPIRSSLILSLLLVLTVLHRAVDPVNLLPQVASAQSAPGTTAAVERRPNLIPNPSGFWSIDTCDDPSAPDTGQRIPGSTCVR